MVVIFSKRVVIILLLLLLLLSLFKTINTFYSVSERDRNEFSLLFNITIYLSGDFFSAVPPQIFQNTKRVNVRRVRFQFDVSRGSVHRTIGFSDGSLTTNKDAKKCIKTEK